MITRCISAGVLVRFPAEDTQALLGRATARNRPAHCIRMQPTPAPPTTYLKAGRPYSPYSKTALRFCASRSMWRPYPRWPLPAPGMLTKDRSFRYAGPKSPHFPPQLYSLAEGRKIEIPGPKAPPVCTPCAIASKAGAFPGGSSRTTGWSKTLRKPSSCSRIFRSRVRKTALIPIQDVRQPAQRC